MALTKNDQSAGTQYNDDANQMKPDMIISKSEPGRKQD